jgi:hypothetical protein
MKKFGLIFSFVLLLTAVNSHAADSGLNRYAMCQKDQQTAAQELLSALVQGRDQAQWATPVRDLVSAETCMLSYGGGYTSERLYGRLAKDLKPGDFRQFGWRVLQARFKEFGFELEPAASAFGQSL